MLLTKQTSASLSDLASHELEIVQRMKYRKNYLEDTSLTQPTASRLSRSRSLKSRSGTRGSRSGGG